jgi:hypothetical protein
MLEHTAFGPAFKGEEAKQGRYSTISYGFVGRPSRILPQWKSTLVAQGEISAPARTKFHGNDLNSKVRWIFNPAADSNNLYEDLGISSERTERTG